MNRRNHWTSVFVFGALFATISTNTISSSHAQQSQQQYDRLKKLLDEKFIPPPTQNQKPPTVDKKDLHWIAPKPNQQGGKQGLLAPPSDPRHMTLRLADSRTGGLTFVVTDAVDFGVPSLRAPLAQSSGRIQLAQTPAARRNAYIIQLKPNTTSQQITALLAKYGLTIKGGQSSYGILLVERNAPPAATSEAERLSDILNQQIVAQLRREPIVASASVDTTMRRNTVPLSSSTSVTKDGATIIWTWKGFSSTAMASAGVNTGAPTPQLDGNWGMKALRMPAVWTILKRLRAEKPDQAQPKLAVIDTGFAKHDDLAVNILGSPNQAPITAVASSIGNCGTAHGNHVLGIAGATHGNGIGVDGIIPRAKIDAVPWTDVLVQGDDPAATSEETRTTFFSQALFAIMSYVETSTKTNLRVVNVSLGYNFGARPVIEGDPEKIAGLKETIEAQAVMFASLAKKHEDSILFVAAAGNDSSGRTNPYDAKWSSPIVWAATQLPPSRRPKNILIVEANDRSGQRADFSNIGGHVAAPGVDILSTLWPGDNPYGACPGTSMASPHVAGLAALLFEFDPNKKPAEIADIIKTSAIKPIVVPGGPPRPPGAPRVDALEAVLKVSPQNLTRLADLNRDGKVDIDDLKIFVLHLSMIDDNRKNGTPFKEDLNGDGVVNDNECNWPLIDLNGSGSASMSFADSKWVMGNYRTDIDIIGMAWTDKVKNFKTALKELGLDVILPLAESTPLAVSSKGCR